MKKRNVDSNVNDKIRAKNRRLLLQDLGLLVFLAGILAAERSFASVNSSTAVGI